MSVHVELTPAEETWLRAAAGRTGQRVEVVVTAILRQHIPPGVSGEARGTETEVTRQIAETRAKLRERDPDLTALVARHANRSAEERAVTRAIAEAALIAPIPLPEGTTLESVIVGRWPGSETDEQVEAALRELS